VSAWSVRWPVPLALGVSCGAALVTSAPEALAALRLVGLASVLVALLAVAVLAWPASGTPMSALAAAALVAATGAGVGAVRGHAWATAADPWATHVGHEVDVVGRSDGDVVWVRGRGGLVLRGGGVPEGDVRLRGVVEALPGRRNPGGFDARAHWRRRGAWAALRVLSLERAPPRASARSRLRRGVVAGLSAEAAALVQAMTLGLRDDLGDLRDAFAASGLAHVLALSGLHVGVLAASLVLALRTLGVGRAGVAVALLPGLVGYVAVVGATPSVVRAALMVSAISLSVAARAGPPAPLAALSLAATTSLVVSPGWIGDVGFGLSYLSVLGIVVLAPPLLALVPSPPTRPAAVLRAALAGGAAVSVAAQLATASLVASTFGAAPLLAPLANLVAVPLASLLVPLGFLAAMAGLVHEGAATAVNALTGVAAGVLVAVARLAARAPSLPWAEIDGLGHLLFAVALTAVAAALHRRARPWHAATVVLVAAAVSVAVPPRYATPELVVLDVGQGDAVVIRAGGAHAVLVDGGGTPRGDHDVGARIVVPALRALGVRALAVVVATHADLDHIEGLVAVLRLMPVGELWIGHPAPDRAAFRDLVREAALRGVPVREVRRGEGATLGRLRLDVLHPTTSPMGEPNDDSVVLLVRVDGHPWALLAGDVSAVVEADLPIPPVPLIMAPHHGSATSTSEALLRAAQPRTAVVSVGSNRFGHPAPSVIERLARHGVDVRVTRDEGALRIPHPVP
jgi:competence protein ComEC